MRWAGVAMAVALTAAAPVRAADLRADDAAWRAGHEPEIVGQLDQLTRIPSVAADLKGLDAAAPPPTTRWPWSPSCRPSTR